MHKIELKNRFIEDLFHENRFNLFVSFCRQNGMIQLRDLEGFDFDRLQNVQGIGTKKIHDIRERYEQAELQIAEEQEDSFSQADTASAEESLLRLSVQKLFVVIHPELNNLDLDVFFSLGVPNRIIGKLKEAGFRSVGSLSGITKQRLVSLAGKRRAEEFEELQPVVSGNLIGVLERVLEMLSTSDEYLMVLYRAEGLTLNAIGDMKNVTRERIRQIINKFNFRLDPVLRPIIDRMMQEKGYVTATEILDIYDNDDYDRILMHWCKSIGYYDYLDFADAFIPAQDNKEAVNHKMKEIAESFVGEGISFEEHREELEWILGESGYPFVTVENFTQFLADNKYRFFGSLVVKGRQSYGYLCSRLVGQYFPEGIKLYDETDLGRLRMLVKEIYGDLNLPEDDRVLSIRLSDYTVLCGRGKVTTADHIQVGEDLLEEIHDYIERSSRAEVYYSEVFSVFESQLKSNSNIDNYHFLHGVLKLYFEDEYDFADRDYLRKRGAGLVSGRFSVRLKRFILQAGHPVTKKEIKSRFPGMTDIMLSMAVYNDPELFQWEYNQYYLMGELTFSGRARNMMEQEIDSILNETGGYCSDQMLFGKIRTTCDVFLQDNEIKTATTLFSICAKLFSDKYEFRRPHICRKGWIDTMNGKNIILKMMDYPKVLDYQEYLRYGNRFQWPSITNGIIFYDIEKEYYRVSEDLYVQRAEFSVSLNQVREIEEVVRDYKKNVYMPIGGFTSWEEFPDIGYAWNPFLLRMVLEKFGSAFRIIDTKSKDRRFEKGIVLDHDNPISSYDELVVSLLKENNITEISEYYMLKFLASRGLCKQVIPKELYESDFLVYKGEKFILLR